ncbi:hypothetical protein [Calycomorphotria hydatis]|uniref:Uncharacterized protein n=1 Tax=Calycomorphotria hydatis TaxID=2528027 RepID=A0A517TFB1_9PLAN|nr:hypothetical protein [Calycomorphotria hydatis]QDT67063.1 hypothetical protein V22_43350 [Calycomorphotria hydatis]
MKINGQPLPATFQTNFALPRPDGTRLVLTLTPLPLGFHNRLRSRGILAPSAPVRVARDSNGKPLRDEAGLAIMLVDDQDSAYRQEIELYHQRIATLIVSESLQHDQKIEFETPTPVDDDWKRYADKLFRELERSGFSAGDLILLCEEISRMSNLTGDHLRETCPDFSPPDKNFKTP